MSHKKNIVHVNFTMNIGGIEAFIMNVVRSIDLNKFTITILTYSNEKFDYEEELASLGVEIKRISSPKHVSIVNHIKELIEVFKSGNFDAVHSHTYFDSGYVVLAAKIAGVKLRIVHSHTALANSEERLYKKIKWLIARILLLLATSRIACSNEAGKALFGKYNFDIIPNGIDLQKFSFDPVRRKAARKEVNVGSDAVLIGHIGRFDIPKNHSFLLDIFKEYLKRCPDAKLVLVGSGKLDSQIRQKVKDSGLVESVIFLGDRSDVDLLLNAFDYIVFPSIYEGLPVSLVEAQANGLKVLASTAVSPEIKLTKDLQFYSLDNSAKRWANLIGVVTNLRTDFVETTDLKFFDIKNTVKQLSVIYEHGDV